MFWTDLLPIIRSLNPVSTAVGVCHASYVDCLLARCISLVFIVRSTSYIRFQPRVFGLIIWGTNCIQGSCVVVMLTEVKDVM
jgi:hypothetical protein